MHKEYTEMSDEQLAQEIIDVAQSGTAPTLYFMVQEVEGNRVEWHRGLMLACLRLARQLHVASTINAELQFAIADKSERFELIPAADLN